MKMTLGEKIFVGIPACVLLVLVVDATHAWTYATWFKAVTEFISGYFMWTVWENRDAFRRPCEHTN